MKRIQVTDNFFLDEFIDPVTYAARGASSIELMDMRIILAVQYLREVSGKPITINTWSRRGKLSLRGYRPEGTKTGAKWSQHKFGRALDINIGNWTPQQMFDFVKQHERYLIERQLVTTIENVTFTKTWLHIDCRHTGRDTFLIVNP